MKFSLSLAPRGLAIALGVLALAAPAALAQDQDLRAPDQTVPKVAAVVDLRSPDARDAATPPAPVAQAGDDRFDWPSPAIVAGAIAGFILLALGGYAAAYRARVRPAR
jgi:hypothetical protein